MSRNTLSDIRDQLDSLGGTIEDLRGQSERLSASAKARSTLVLLERAVPSNIDEDAEPDEADDYVPQHRVPQQRGPAQDLDDQAGAVEDPEDDTAHSGDESATVLEFPVPGDDVPEIPDASFFGGEPDVNDEATDESSEEAAEEPAQKALAVVGATAREDGLDAIGKTESTAMPTNWNVTQTDDDAFDKFFSADVEPEPAQRWLLSD